jgi:DNA-directed RNA polymerase I subunit RPA12
MDFIRSVRSPERDPCSGTPLASTLKKSLNFAANLSSYKRENIEFQDLIFKRSIACRSFGGKFIYTCLYIAVLDIMAAIGSLLFCTTCGNLLESSTGDEKALLICDVCHSANHGKKSEIQPTKAFHSFYLDKPPPPIETRSKANAFPSLLRQKHSTVQTLNADDMQTKAKIQETCAQCGRKEMYYYTKQLRSADEGSTVFHECVCGYKFTVNN